MTRDDIMRLAREAQDATPGRYWSESPDTDILLERFAALVAAHEREACARVCESEHVGKSITDEDVDDGDAAYNCALVHAAASIRAGSPLEQPAAQQPA